VASGNTTPLLRKMFRLISFFCISTFWFHVIFIILRIFVTTTSQTRTTTEPTILTSTTTREFSTSNVQGKALERRRAFLID